MKGLVCVALAARTPDVADEGAAIRGHDLGGDKVVAGETPRARHDPDATAQREPGDADGRAASGGYALARSREGGVDVDQLRAGADRHTTLLPKVDAAHRAGVNDEPRTGRPSAVAVAAAP